MFLKFKNIKRLKEVSHILTKYGFGYLIDTLKLPPILSRKKTTVKLTRGKRIRLIFEELGAIFIKFGQILSTRPDIIPEDIIIELQKLQDEVPAFSFKKVEEEFNIVFNKPIKTLFKEFKEIPIASASIGQVHLAMLHTGQKVVVKVQRPNIEKIIHKDLDLLLFFATLFEKYIPESRVYTPIRLIEEFKKSIQREINYETEAHNLEKINQFFKNDKNVYTPNVYWEYTNTKFLTMEYIEGIKISDFEKLDKNKYNRKLIAKRGSEAIFKQIFEYGFFHADPHAGNIIVLPQNKVCFLDYGMVGYLDEEAMSFLANFLVATIEGKGTKLISALLEEELISGSCNLNELRLDVNEVFINYYNLPLKQINIGKLLNEIMKIISKHHIHIPSHFMLVIKTLVTIEGIGRQLDPNFNPMIEIQPFVKKLLWQQYNPKKLILELGEVLKESFNLLKSLPKDVRFLVKKITKGEVKVNFEHKGLEPLNNALDRASNQFSFSIIMAALIIASALIIQSNTPPFLWDMPILGVIGFILTSIVGFILLISIIRKS